MTTKTKTTKTTSSTSDAQEGTVHDADPRALFDGSHLAIDEARAGAALDAASDEHDAPSEEHAIEQDAPEQLTGEAVVELTETLVRVPVRVIATGKGVRWNETHERRIAFTDSDKAKLRPGAEQVAKLLSPYVSDSKWVSAALYGIALFDVVSAKLSMLAPEFAGAKAREAEAEVVPENGFASSPTATRPRDP